MKTLKKIEIIPMFVEYIPNTLKQHFIYISKEYKTVVHLCLCGCVNLSVLNLNDKNGWKLIEKNNKISFIPSILNTNCPNKYHYVITNNVANIL
jgi:hypothetical protein